MLIYIPTHLREIGVIKQMIAMINEYSSKYYESSVNSFDDYNYSLKIDPVKRFLSMCLKEENIRDGESYESVLLYLSHLFYSVKGTTKVFNYMKTYLGLEFQGDIIYTTKYIEFTLINLEVTDETKFYEALRDFLDCLFYFQEFKTSAVTVKLKISNTISNRFSAGVKVYNYLAALYNIQIPYFTTDNQKLLGLEGITDPFGPGTKIVSNTYDPVTGGILTVSGSIVRVSDGLFNGCQTLKLISLPDTIGKIGNNAFEICSELQSITIPAGCTSLGERAFAGCTKLSNVVLPSSLLSIGLECFLSCPGITNLSIPAGVTSIGNFALRGTGIVSLSIPSSCTTLGTGIVAECTSLRTINVVDGNFAYKSEGNCIISRLDNTVIAGCLGSHITSTDITTIGDYAFFGCTRLGEIDFPESVKFLGKNSLAGCTGLGIMMLRNTYQTVELDTDALKNLPTTTRIIVPIDLEVAYKTSWSSLSSQIEGFTDVVYTTSNNTAIDITSTVEPFGVGSNIYSFTSSVYTVLNGVTEFADNLFKNQSTLTSISIPPGVSRLGNSALFGTSITSLTIPDSVESIGQSLVCSSTLASISVGNDNSKYYSPESSNCIIERSLTGDNNIVVLGCKNSVIPEESNVTVIGDGAFNGSGVAYIEIPQNIKRIEVGAFSETPLVSIDLSDVKVLGNSVFTGCSNLSTVTFDNIEEIGDNAFFRCTSLTSIEFPDSCTTIRSEAFSGCSSVTRITCHASTPPELGDSAFTDIPADCRIYVPAASLSDYKDAEGWKSRADYIYSIINTVYITYTSSDNTSVGPSSSTPFGAGNTYTNSYDTTTGVGTYTVSAQGDVTEISDSAFSGNTCANLVSLNFPTTITRIGSNAFSGKTNLSNPVFPASLLYINESAYEGCTGITSLTFPSSVCYIGNNAFYGTGVTGSLNFSSMLAEIGEGAFKDCTRVTGITLGGNLLVIGKEAFSGCTGITSLTLPSSLTTLGDKAFSGCTGLVGTINTGSLTTISESSFRGCTGISEIVLTSSITSVSDHAFEGCSNVVSITSYNTDPPILGEDAFLGIPATCPIYVPAGYVEAYQGAAGWSEREQYINEIQ